MLFEAKPEIEQKSYVFVSLGNLGRSRMKKTRILETLTFLTCVENSTKTKKILSFLIFLS